jgi:DNA (cytosine-5)-methyltransferase 1
MPTITAGGNCARPAGAAHALGLVAPRLARKHLITGQVLQQNGGFYDGDGRSLEQPFSTITSRGSQQQLLTARLAEKLQDEGELLQVSHLTKMYGSCAHGQSLDKPMATVTAGGQHLGEVRAFLAKQYSQGGQWNDLNDPMHTVTTKDRFTLVSVELGQIGDKRDLVRAFAREYLGMDDLTVEIGGVLYEVVDIGLRMLVPRELYRAQGFSDSYVIERGHDGRPFSKSAQVRMCGNSVAPPVAAALIRANFVHEKQLQAA